MPVLDPKRDTIPRGRSLAAIRRAAVVMSRRLGATMGSGTSQQSAMQQDELVIILADISGYTRFMVENRTSAVHGQLCINSYSCTPDTPGRRRVGARPSKT